MRYLHLHHHSRFAVGLSLLVRHGRLSAKPVDPSWLLSLSAVEVAYSLSSLVTGNVKIHSHWS